MRSKLLKKVVAGVLAAATVVSMCFTGGGESTTVKAASSSSVSGVSTVSNMPSDFARGVDISEVIALESSGIAYKYLDGTSGDIFDILAGAGVNYVRIRIWNNPYDSTSPYKGYGAGNCDLYNAKVLGKRATDAGMKVFIDFHYSDFWADPAKQYAPKAWSSYSLAYKKDAVYNFTYDSLCELLDYGVDVGMVQIGNETNGSMCGVGGLYDGTWNLSTGVAELMQQGCYAVDDVNSSYGKSMLKVLHFTDLLSNGEWYAECVNNMGVDYDVFATSFYPMWHGSTDDLAETLLSIAKKYNKKVLVAETAYPYTDTNNDSENNMVHSSSMSYSNYSVSVDGQAAALHDVFEAVASVNKSMSGYGLGAFYWAPEWIGVDSSTSGTYGTGWASSSSGNYELLYESSVSSYSTTDRGSSWDNMTLFDANGQAMKSLYVFNDICGNTSTTTSGSSGSSSNGSSSGSGSSSTTTTTTELNANNLTKGTYKSDYTYGDFTIGASSSKYISVESASATVNGTSYTQRIKMNGAANSTGRYIKFTTTGAATVEVIGISTSTSATRVIRLAKDSVGGTTVGDATVSGTAGVSTYTVSEAGTYYLYSTNSGIYIYDVKVTSTSSSSSSDSSTSTSGTLDGTYYIKSYYSGKYLDVADGSSANSANIQQYSYSGTDGQKFKLVSAGDGYYYIYTGASSYSKVIDVAGKSTADGANILQYAYNGNANQKFKLEEVSDGVYAILTGVTSGASCLDVYGWSTADGGNIAQWTYWGGACQLWYLESAN